MVNLWWWSAREVLLYTCLPQPARVLWNRLVLVFPRRRHSLFCYVQWLQLFSFLTRFDFMPRLANNVYSFVQISNAGNIQGHFRMVSRFVKVCVYWWLYSAAPLEDHPRLIFPSQSHYCPDTELPNPSHILVINAKHQAR